LQPSAAKGNENFKCFDCGKSFEPFTDLKTNKWLGADVAYKLAANLSDDGKSRCKACKEKLKLSETGGKSDKQSESKQKEQ
jgi:hypothetical protein